MQKEGGRKDKKFRSLEVRRKYIALKNVILRREDKQELFLRALFPTF
jgi:hypothetical protein